MQPLAEVFGFPVDNLSESAQHYRANRLCPYHNRIAHCTKDKANDPLGVCSVFETSGHVAITCPVRFRQDWLIAQHAARFFFPAGTQWTTLTEVRLTEASGGSAGNIDVVLVAYDEEGKVVDFGALEVQAVYISGNVRQPFDLYIQNPATYLQANHAPLLHRPRPDYLSSSRKRLIPQLLYKGSLLKAWGKRQAVALHRRFFETLPPLPSVPAYEADLAWLVYDLEYNEENKRYHLVLETIVYTPFEAALAQISTPQIGAVDDFARHLQGKLTEKLETGNPNVTG